MVAASPLGGARGSGELAKFTFSEECRIALQGGVFDARKWLFKPRKTGDASADEASNRCFRARVKLVDVLRQRPDLVEATLSFAEDRALGFQPVAEASGGERWNSTYMVVGKIPKYWRGEWLEKHYHALGFTKDTLGALDSRDPTALNYIFDFICGVLPTTKLPRTLLTKVVCDRVFLKRASQLGRCTGEWVRKVLGDEDEKVDWSKAGCYVLKKDGARNLVIEHCSGEKVVAPKYWNFGEAVPVKNNMWDLSAKVVLGEDDESCLCTKFGKLQGPNAKEIKDVNASLKALGDAEARVYELQVKMMSAEAESASAVGMALQENEKTRRKHLAQKALAKQRGCKRNFSAIATMAVPE